MTGLKRLSRSCPVCEAARGEVLHHQTFVLPEGHPLSRGYVVVGCAGCGLVFADTEGLQKDYDELYANQSIYSSRPGADEVDIPEWEMARLAGTARELARVLPGTSQLVDLGSGSGAMLTALRQEGFERIVGVDPSEDCVRMIRQRGFPAVRGSFSSLPAELDPPDGVLLSHVLEHVRDVRPALRSLRAWLREGAALYVEVPDATRYGDYLFSPFQDFNTEHINHFSLLTMERLLGGCGFRVESAGQKEILSSETKPYPALFCLARASVNPPRPELRDDTLRESILRYIDLSRAMLEVMDARLTRVAGSMESVIVWGTGQLAFKLLSQTCLARMRIRVFVDGNPALLGRRLLDRPVVAPASLTSSPEPIVIASTLHAQAIEKKIRELGLRNPVVRLDSAETKPEEAPR
ncbi:MAG: class I SAM-dependent methyltransferase [Thermoanaerobaculia bacterium]|nr:class I SAM-dependent methyltransferase [Thermoanaerobaculia bacterium]